MSFHGPGCVGEMALPVKTKKKKNKERWYCFFFGGGLGGKVMFDICNNM